MRTIDIVIIGLLILSIITAGIMICEFSKFKLVAHGIYMVDTKIATIDMDRSWAEVMETCNHEYQHYKNYEHFQEDFKGGK